ncbi:(2Fe-2S)-binding protein [Rhodovibrionaceae bacterium A322]
MFRRLSSSPQQPTVEITLDGQTVPLQEGDNLATALLLSQSPVARTTPVSGAERAPYCAMGVCFDCLVTVDGRSNQQACLIEAKAGMVVTRQAGKSDLLSAQPDEQKASQQTPNTPGNQHKAGNKDAQSNKISGADK